MPYLTIIVPHKNSYESLIDLLETVPNEIKVIIVDDKSDLRVQDKLRDLNRNNLTVVFNDFEESNAGFARNLGIESLDENCEWVMFSDADDLMNYDNLIALINKLKYETADVVLTGVDARYNSGEPSARADYIKGLLTEYPHNSNNILFRWVGPIGKAIRKKVIDDNQLKYESRVASNDVVFSAKLAALRPACTYYPMNVYTIIQSETSLTASLNVKKAKDRLEATWIRNRINQKCKSGVRLHYGVMYYKHIFMHGENSELIRYLPGEIKNLAYSFWFNFQLSFLKLIKGLKLRG